MIPNNDRRKNTASEGGPNWFSVLRGMVLVFSFIAWFGSYLNNRIHNKETPDVTVTTGTESVTEDTAASFTVSRSGAATSDEAAGHVTCAMPAVAARKCRHLNFEVTPERRALLNTIRFAEGTWKNGSEIGYRVHYGGTLFQNLGRYPDQIIHHQASAAAGAYRFPPATWRMAEKALPLRDFGPKSQDKAALYLICRREALGLADRGRFTKELAHRLAPEWASFPKHSSYYGQPVRSFRSLQNFYRANLAAVRRGSPSSPSSVAAGPPPALPVANNPSTSHPRPDRLIPVATSADCDGELMCLLDHVAGGGAPIQPERIPAFPQAPPPTLVKTGETVAYQGPPPAPSPALSPTAPSISRLSSNELSELRYHALRLINNDRAIHGLPPVVLGANPASQLHAEDMLVNDYFGHWWADGRKPYMVYTQTGGTSYAAENAATAGWTDAQWVANSCGWHVNCTVPEPKEKITDLQWGMMYDDAHANWGHRDNILGKTHRAVSIGIGFNGRRTTFVQHFEGGAVQADGPPILDQNGKLCLSLSKRETGITVGGISIAYDPPPTPKTPTQIDALNSYCTGGGFTTHCPESAAARILEPPPLGHYYTSLDANAVVASRWIDSPDNFMVTARMGSLLQQPGVYTVVVWRDDEREELSEQLVALSLFVE